MIQSILIGILLSGSAVYLIRAVYKSFAHSGHCEAGCGKCGTINMEVPAREMQKKSRSGQF